MPKQSTLPEKIISALLEDPTLSRQELRERLNVSYQAIQKHIHVLEDQGTVKSALLVRPRELKKSKSTFLIFIKTRFTGKPNPPEGEDYQRDLCREIAKPFKQGKDFVEGIIFGGAEIVMGGPFDIILTLYAENQNSLEPFVTKFLRTRMHIVETSTAWVLAQNWEISPNAKPPKNEPPAPQPAIETQPPKKRRSKPAKNG